MKLNLFRSMNPEASQDAIIKEGKIRFTVLTSRIIRIEHDKTSFFCDRPSQVFWYRKQPVPKFDCIKLADRIEIITEHLHLYYFKGEEELSPKNLFIELKETGTIWHYGDKDSENLKGTARTLDNADGPIPLENGLMSRNGWSIIDDSSSLIFDENGWIKKRDHEELDIYFFGYGTHFKQCLQDFCKIAGMIPMIPRWALGNWWSRYWEYTQEELMELMNKFEEKQTPLSVCVIDMDWHVVNIEEYIKKRDMKHLETLKFHDGWTGFTWNEDLFPDYKALLKFLHEEKGLRVALNIHPASGIFPHEKQYERVARYMGIDPTTYQPIEFDLTVPRFYEAYFNFIYHPYEQEGIDFWWTDWQQGETSKIEGLDPLWWINHLSFYDSGRNEEKRPFIFSRYGGLGNHRYPIGFSGDTFATWQSLDFLPYFTSTASNIGFTWWSHDLGGHMGGKGFDPELYIRWIQFGLFNPIFRLHSTKNPFNERLPWEFNEEIFQIAKKVMQLRHSFIPYIYTMAWKTWNECLPLIRPMYYEYPLEENAYNFPNQYFFGSELLCAPFTSKIDEDIGQSRQIIWLPEGEWFNFFTGEYHKGNQVIVVHGLLEDIPVFAKAGGIIPLADYSNEKFKWNDTSNPPSLHVIIFPGKDNNFQLYEDDGVSQDYLKGKNVLTEFCLISKKHSLLFRVKKPLLKELFEWIPERRSYTFTFKGINPPDMITIILNGNEISGESEFQEKEQALKINKIILTPFDELEITLTVNSGSMICKKERIMEKCKKLLKYFNLESTTKKLIHDKLPSVIKSNQKLSKFFEILLKGQKAGALPISSTDLQILNNVIPLIQIANIYEELLFESDKKLIKNQLFNVDLTDLTEARNKMWIIILKSIVIKNLLSLKEKQIQALLETVQNGKTLNFLTL